MIRVLQIIVLLCVITHGLSEYNLKTCKCWEFHHAAIVGGAVVCEGDSTYDFQPCGLPKLPDCQCSPEATTKETDMTGSWCVKRFNGKTVRKWDCDNREEFEAYKKDLVIYYAQLK